MGKKITMEEFKKQAEMEKLESIKGKTVEKVKISKKLDEGIIIFFTDGANLECCWNNWEGYYNYEQPKLDVE